VITPRNHILRVVAAAALVASIAACAANSGKVAITKDFATTQDSAALIPICQPSPVQRSGSRTSAEPEPGRIETIVNRQAAEPFEAGSWWDASHPAFVLNFTDDPSNHAEYLGLLSPFDVEIRQVAYSSAQLQAVFDRVFAILSGPSGDRAFVADPGIDPTRNRVILNLTAVDERSIAATTALLGADHPELCIAAESSGPATAASSG
jgi:hypothetical protein